MSRRPATARPTGSLRRDISGECNLHHETLRQELLQTLLALPVPAFDRLIARLLQECNYAQVQVLSEAQGGADLVATTRSGLSSTRTLVQAKQYRTPVSRRFVDELRGAMLRSNASHGLLLTTSSFFGPARVAVRKPGPLPVRLLDGRELLDLLLAHQLGVREDSSEQLHLDADFFERLEQEPLSEHAIVTTSPHCKAHPRYCKAHPRSLRASSNPIASRACRCGHRRFHHPQTEHLKPALPEDSPPRRCWGLFRRCPTSDWQRFLG